MRDRYLFVQSQEGVQGEREEAGWNDDVRGLNVTVMSSYTASMLLLLGVRIYKWWRLTPHHHHHRYHFKKLSSYGRNEMCI